MDTGVEPDVGPKSKTWLKSAAGLVLLVFLGGALLFNQSIKGRAKLGQPAPDWTAEDVEGRTVRLSDFRDQVVLLNIWTTWCISCKEETPALQAFHERYGDRLKLIGLDVREPWDTIKEYMKETAMDFYVVRDRLGRVETSYNVRGYPETWFIDEQGIARVYWEGPLTFEQMQDFYLETTGRNIDGAGVGPVAAGAALRAVAVTDQGGVRQVFLGTSQGLFRGEVGADRKVSWQRVAGPGLESGDVTALLASSGAPGVVFAGGPGIGLVRSRDGGATWEALMQGLPGGRVRALTGDGSTLYVWVDGTGLYLSSDGGDSWRPVGGTIPRGTQVTGMAMNPLDRDHLLVAGDGGLAFSKDGGNSWGQGAVREVIHTINTNPFVFGVAFSATDAGVAYLSTNKGIWKSADGGRSAKWLRASHARRFDAVATGSADATAVIGAPNGDIYVSDDAGRTWNRLTQ